MCDETDDLDEDTLARIEAHKAYKQEQDGLEYYVNWADPDIVEYSLKGLNSIKLGE